MGSYDGRPYEMYPDNCERCVGTMGGVRGNENRYPVEGGGYRVLCDYCSVEIDDGLAPDIPCHCGRPLGVHNLMNIESIEAIWKEGIELVICCGESSDGARRYGSLSLVCMKEDKPNNPCDVDYMKEISS